MRPDGAYKRAKMHMAGEALLIVEFGTALHPAINEAALAFDRYLQDNPVKGVCESAPTNTSVAVRFDPLAVDPRRFRAQIDALLSEIDWFCAPARIKANIRANTWRLPVCYGGAFGPDLQHIAARQSVPVEALIKAHGACRQRVYMIGFAPGFLYTGQLSDLFDIPRSKTINPRVPPGSICVAIAQSVISSTFHPTGWHVIGRTPFVNFDPRHEPVFTIKAGDEIEFTAIDPRRYERLSATTGRGLEHIDEEGKA